MGTGLVFTEILVSTPIRYLKAQVVKQDIELDCLFDKRHILPNRPSLNNIPQQGNALNLI